MPSGHTDSQLNNVNFTPKRCPQEAIFYCVTESTRNNICDGTVLQDLNKMWPP